MTGRIQLWWWQSSPTIGWHLGPWGRLQKWPDVQQRASQEVLQGEHLLSRDVMEHGGTYFWTFFRNQGTWLGFELRSKPNIVIKVGTVERTPWTMRAQDGTVRFLYLAAKTSPSFYPCHWVSQWVLSDLLTPAIASTKLCDLVFKAKISFNIFLLIW